jgi:UDP-N-acetylmuramate dehydrogenase
MTQPTLVLPDDWNGTVQRDAPLAAKSSFRSGGAADWLVEPRDSAALVGAWRAASDAGLPVTILGGGSNILVADRGARGVVMLLGKKFGGIEIINEDLDAVRIRVDAGCPLARLCRWVATQSLTGIEGLSGIPGSAGGAFRINAGAYGQEIGDVTERVTVYEPGGDVRTLTAADCGFAYRWSKLIPAKVIVLGGTLRLPRGDRASIEARMTNAAMRRNTTQPHGVQSAGSCFKNPDGGFAWRLLKDSGASELRVGGARFSELHANYLIRESGPSLDVLALGTLARERVRDATGTWLMPEWELFGEWPADDSRVADWRGA